MVQAQMRQRIEIRRPRTPEELDQAQKAKFEAWGFLDLSTGEGSIKPMYENFPEGFLTAFVDGEGAGNFTTLRMNYDIGNPSVKAWEELTAAGTGSNVVRDGDTLYGVSLGVSPRFRGKNIGAMLVNSAIQKTIELECRQFVLGCRIPDYHRYSDIPVEQYMALRRHDGEYLDPELRFYSRCGMRFLKPLKDYMVGAWADPDCLNYGVLSVWTNPYAQAF